MTKRIGETSYRETALGIIPRSKLIPLEIEGIKRAWDFVLKKYQKGKIPLSTSFLKELHRIGFGWIFPKEAGQFRKIELQVSHHLPPKHYQVPELMGNFIDDVKTRIKYLPSENSENFLQELIDLLAWAHHRFLSIHPFFDYNGRIGRLLLNIILLNLNLPPLELHVETPSTRKKYVQALQKADQGDYEDLKYLIASALKESAQEI